MEIVPSRGTIIQFKIEKKICTKMEGEKKYSLGNFLIFAKF